MRAQSRCTNAHGSRSFASVASRHRGLCSAVFVLALGVCSSVQAQERVYDFSSGAGTTNTAFKGGGSTLPPATNMVPTGVFVAADYTAVATLDDSRQTSGGTPTKALTRFVFTVSEDPATLLDLTVDWEGNTSTGGTVKLFLWNANTSTYTDTSQSTTSTSDATLTYTTTSPAHFIDASGKVTVLVANTAGSKFINTDYVKITVSLPECIVDSDCQETPIDNVCTTDACSSGACTRTNNTAPCTDDGNPCRDDVCSGGSCTHPVNHLHLPCGNAGTECRNQDTCGDFGNCVNRGFKSGATICTTGTSQGGDCDDDAADHCTGTSNECVDAFITSCTNSDGCCPPRCDFSNDTDCGKLQRQQGR